MSPLRAWFRKALKTLAVQQSMRRRAAQQRDVLREGQQRRAAMEKVGRQRGAQKEAAARKAALQQTLHSAFRLETWRGPAVQRWAPRVTAVVAVLALIGDVLLYSRYSTERPLVTVGHRVIRQREYLADLDGAAGKGVLNRIVYAELIRQAATQANVMPSPPDVDARIADLRQHSTQALPPDAQIWDQVQLQLALENLRIRGVTATDAEAAQFYAQHKALFATPARANTTLVYATTAADAARAARLLAAGKSEAEVAAQPGLRVAGVGGFSVDLSRLPLDMRRQVEQVALSLPVGSVKTVALARNVFFTLRPQQRESGSQAPLSEVRDQVARLVRLQKAPSGPDELAILYHANPPTFDMARYGNYFSDIPPATPNGTGPKTSSLPQQ